MIPLERALKNFFRQARKRSAFNAGTRPLPLLTAFFLVSGAFAELWFPGGLWLGFALALCAGCVGFAGGTRAATRRLRGRQGKLLLLRDIDRAAGAGEALLTVAQGVRGPFASILEDRATRACTAAALQRALPPWRPRPFLLSAAALAGTLAVLLSGMLPRDPWLTPRAAPSSTAKAENNAADDDNAFVNDAALSSPRSGSGETKRDAPSFPGGSPPREPSPAPVIARPKGPVDSSQTAPDASQTGVDASQAARAAPRAWERLVPSPMPEKAPANNPAAPLRAPSLPLAPVSPRPGLSYEERTAPRKHYEERELRVTARPGDGDYQSAVAGRDVFLPSGKSAGTGAPGVKTPDAVAATPRPYLGGEGGLSDEERRWAATWGMSR